MYTRRQVQMEKAKKLALLVHVNYKDLKLSKLTPRAALVNRIHCKAAIKLLNSDSLWMDENKELFRSLSNLTQCLRVRSTGVYSSRRKRARYMLEFLIIGSKGGWKDPVTIMEYGASHNQELLISSTCKV